MFDGALPKPSPSSHPVDVGLRTEMAITAELVKRGYRVLVPLATNERYDVALDLGDGSVLRAQCKTGRVRRGGILFSTRSVRSNSKQSYVRDYHGEADVFLVFCDETNGIYSVPVDEAPKREMCLRVEPCRNGQSVGVFWASDYELPA